MSTPGNRIEVMHGVNLDQLGRRDPLLYGTLTLVELEQQIDADARELGLQARFFHSNHEGDFVERLHSLRDEADAILINAGAWSHYSWAIRDALEIAPPPRSGDPPVRHSEPRALAARVGVRRVVLRDRLRTRPRRLPRRARADARRAPAGSGVSAPGGPAGLETWWARPVLRARGAAVARAR